MSKIYQISEGYPYRGDKGCFGFSSILLVAGDKRNILFDVGNYSLRKEIIPILSSIDCVVISHLHFDHCSNLDLFIEKQIPIYISSLELTYFDNLKTVDADLFSYFDLIRDSLKIVPISSDIELDKGIKLLDTSGHTNGDLSLEVDKYTILSGDALKNYNDFCNVSSYGNAYSPIDYVECKKKIIDNYPVIYPGHDGVIINGKVKRKMKVREF